MVRHLFSVANLREQRKQRNLGGFADPRDSDLSEVHPDINVETVWQDLPVFGSVGVSSLRRTWETAIVYARAKQLTKITLHVLPGFAEGEPGNWKAWGKQMTLRLDASNSSNTLSECLNRLSTWMSTTQRQYPKGRLEKVFIKLNPKFEFEVTKNTVKCSNDAEAAYKRLQTPCNPTMMLKEAMNNSVNILFGHGNCIYSLSGLPVGNGGVVKWTGNSWTRVNEGVDKAAPVGVAP